MSGQAVVIGGGITGLCAAYEFQRAGWSVTVHEASGRWGGKIHSSPVGDRLVDAGPDAFLARVDHATTLCNELGLGKELATPVAPVPAYVHADGGLHELPPGTMLGVPTDLDALAAGSALVSAAGIERARRDLELPVPDLDADPSVGAVCRERLGDEVTDRLIDPLIGAINASDIDRLSLRAAAPQLAAALQTEGSLIAGMAKFQAAAGAAMGSRTKPVFHGLPGGLARIVDRLVDVLARGGADLRLDSPVTDLAAVGADSSTVVVVAVPAFVAARLLADIPDAATGLDQIGYASVAQATVELPVDAVERVLDASGILFPRAGGTLITASTWLSTKWDHYRRPDHVLIRMSAGRFGDDRPADLDDQTLTATLLTELSDVVAIDGTPTATRVERWPRAFPQYTPGHRERVAAIRAAIADAHPRLAVVGAAFDGIGIPACIDAGRTAALDLMNR